MSQPNQNETGGYVCGVFLTFGMHILLVLFILILMTVTRFPPTFILLPIFFIGLAQLIYVIPVAVYLYNKREFGIMEGVIIGAVITALLNGGCFLASSR